MEDEYLVFFFLSFALSRMMEEDVVVLHAACGTCKKCLQHKKCELRSRSAQSEVVMEEKEDNAPPLKRSRLRPGKVLTSVSNEAEGEKIAYKVSLNNLTY